MVPPAAGLTGRVTPARRQGAYVCAAFPGGALVAGLGLSLTGSESLTAYAVITLTVAAPCYLLARWYLLPGAPRGRAKI